MSRMLALGAVVLLVAGLGMPAQAYHIVGDDGSGGNVDPVASLVTGSTVYSDNWWLATFFTIPSPVGSVSGNDVLGERACGQPVGENGLDVTKCDDDVVQDPIVSPLPVLCEHDDEGVAPAQAGYGGRCWSANQAAGPPAAPSASDWTRMDVFAHAPSSCNPVWKVDGARYYARIGSQQPGIVVEPGESLYYRDLAVYWVSDGHVFYALDLEDAQKNGGSLLGCFGFDTHTADSTIASNSAALCNSADPDAGYNEFDRGSYIVGAPGADQSLCVA